ncbi:hypothetical protein J6590_079497 [Homalodisca vitripennis]|nr:hypothetical protein J6590_079497 [Homalodisca vitripennis]
MNELVARSCARKSTPSVRGRQVSIVLDLPRQKVESQQGDRRNWLWQVVWRKSLTPKL